MDEQELRQIIVAAQAGLAEGFQALLAAYGPRLYGYFIRATGNHHDAEDLLGEISLKLVRQIGRYDERGRFELWLFRIAANMVRDRIRRRKAQPRVMSLSAEDDSGRALSDRLPGNAEAADSWLLAAETSQQLQQALARLDETTREMILLRYFGEMRFKELAKMFKCPLGTVLAKVHRGLKALRKVMVSDVTE